MIKKLQDIRTGIDGLRTYEKEEIVDKINELVEAVNKLYELMQSKSEYSGPK
jgi:hypothetical protein